MAPPRDTYKSDNKETLWTGGICYMLPLYKTSLTSIRIQQHMVPLFFIFTINWLLQYGIYFMLVDLYFKFTTNSHQLCTFSPADKANISMASPPTRRKAFLSTFSTRAKELTDPITIQITKLYSVIRPCRWAFSHIISAGIHTIGALIPWYFKQYCYD